MKIKVFLSLVLLAQASVRATVDANGNGLSDVYEFIYFNGPADPFGDPDDDGASNYDEMVWGTNPTNATSKVLGPTVTRNGMALQFTWPGAPYRSYEFGASENLVTWQPLASGFISSYTENLAASDAPARRLYRLRVSLPSISAPSVAGFTAASRGSDLILTWIMDNNVFYELESSRTLTGWQSVSARAISPYVEPLNSAGAPSRHFYRLRITGSSSGAGNGGLDAWEEALYQQTFGVSPDARDSDGDGMNDLQEFQLGLRPGKKDHPAVRLVVFTPLEK